MNIYKISQSENNDWDTYDSAIVTAENEESASKMHPDDHAGWEENYQWASKPENVKVELIGFSKSNVSEFILKSFNAG